ncbi:MAG: general secretion pathway protein GspK, partial [Methylococcaceae bacterium]|nr:general secretion pathway protein GspK [Methylococcaceae bacterium]
KGVVEEKGRLYLQQLLTGVVAIMPGRPEELLYEPAELAANLADWIDSDDVSANGESEDEPYQRRGPLHRTPNRPLLSVDELRLVAGFDGPLVDALRPFVGVYPLAGGGGINLNTAPEWVLIQLQRGSEVSGLRVLEEEDVRRIRDAREEGTICSGDAPAPDCIPLAELLEGDTLEPAPAERSKVFLVTAVARVVDIERRIETVIDRTAAEGPSRLSWRVR